MSLQFSTHLLDGFDQLAKRTEEVMKSTIEIQSWFKKLHSILDIYAKGLVKISNSSKKKKVGGVSSIEVGTLKDGWQSIHTEIENIGNKHQTCAVTLNNDIIVRMTNFINEKTQARKKFVADSAKINTEMKTALALLQKAKANYYAKFKESEAAKLALNKAKADSNVKPKKINELTTKVTKATDVVTQADKEYQSVLRKTNEKQAKYYETEMPALLEVFQKFEEDRLSFLKEIFDKFAEIVKDFPTAVQSLSDEIATAVENINVQNDIQMFIEQNATGVTPPAPINYEPCDSEVPSSSPSAQNNNNNNAGNVTPVREKEYGVDDNLPKEEKASRIHAQLNELRETIEAEIKSQKGIEKLVTFYAKDPAGQEKAKAELEENKTKVVKLQQSYAQLESQYKDLTGITLAPLDSNEETRDVKIEAPTSQAVKVRALYDYDATNETELSFKENDILSITEQDESGWWFAEIGGRGGFIPRNYVEIQ